MAGPLYHEAVVMTPCRAASPASAIGSPHVNESFRRAPCGKAPVSYAFFGHALFWYAPFLKRRRSV